MSASRSGQHAGRLDGAGARRHRLEVVEPEAAHEHRQQPQQRLLGRAEQAVAPVEGGPQRALPGGQVARPLEQGRVEAGEQGRRVEHPRAGGRQLEGERDARRGGRRSRPRPRRRRGRSPQPGCTAPARSSRRRTAGESSAPASADGSRSGSTTSSVSPRTCSGARLVASTVRPGAASISAATAGAASQQVLEVVEDQQQLLVAQAGGDVGDQVAAGNDDRLDGVADGRQHGLVVEQRRQLDEDHAVDVPVPLRGPDGEREPRLADPAGAGERHQPVLPDQPADPADLLVAADQRGRGHRQLAAAGGGGVTGRSGPGAGPRPDRPDQAGALLLRGVQRVRERAQRVRVGAGAGPSLQRTDRVAAQAGPLGELLLRETGGLAELAQHGTQRLLTTHADAPSRSGDERVYDDRGRPTGRFDPAISPGLR